MGNRSNTGKRQHGRHSNHYRNQGRNQQRRKHDRQRTFPAIHGGLFPHGCYQYRKAWPVVLIVSLFDYTGIWSQSYRDGGYDVLQIDIQHGRDIYNEAIPDYVHGMIIQPPCTHFANSGAQWFAAKDADGRTAEGVNLVLESLRWVRTCKPVWWVLENPAGRIHKLIPELGKPAHKFSPHQYGEPYRKTTWLWGDFHMPHPTTPNAIPQGTRPGQPDEWYSKVGGSSLATKNYRSATSAKFAHEFFRSNP